MPQTGTSIPCVRDAHQRRIVVQFAAKSHKRRKILGDSADYADRHPPAEAVALVVEVADATLDFDRTIKKAIYAHAGIPAYWIVNLIDGRLEVYANPSGPAERADYRERRDYLPGDEVPLVVNGVEVARVPVKEIFS